jgi:thioredoxin 1
LSSDPPPEQSTDDHRHSGCGLKHGRPETPIGFVTFSLFVAQWKVGDCFEGYESEKSFQPMAGGEEGQNMLSLIVYALIGGGIGAALGWFGNCSTGSCPLTANWRRGAVYGAVLGSLFYFISGGSTPASMNESTTNVKLIQEARFDAEVIHQSPSPVVVDFYATWCGPCKVLSPRLDQLAGSFTNEIKFVKINVDEAPNLSRRFNIQGIPTLLFFKDGMVVDSVVGLLSSDALKARLEALVETNSTAGDPR